MDVHSSICILHLSFALPYITSDNQLMKKLSWFCGNWIPFEWKYWMTLHATWIQIQLNVTQYYLDLESIELNSNSTKFNCRKMGYKLVQKVLKIYSWLWRWKTNIKNTCWKTNNSCIFPLWSNYSIWNWGCESIWSKL
jgi:hypothetical protein